MSSEPTIYCVRCGRDSWDTASDSRVQICRNCETPRWRPSALRAALRSDSPVPERLHPFWVKLDSDGMVDGGFYTESGPGLTKVWLDVGEVPASTGGERGEPDRAVFYEVGYRDGYFAGQAGRPADPSVPDSLVPGWIIKRMPPTTPTETVTDLVVRCSGEVDLPEHVYLLPRPQVEGDE